MIKSHFTYFGITKESLYVLEIPMVVCFYNAIVVRVNFVTGLYIDVSTPEYRDEMFTNQHPLNTIGVHDLHG